MKPNEFILSSNLILRIKVGTTPAAIATHTAISIINPDIVINAGTAGGFKHKGGKIGDVFVSTVLRHHDRRIPIPGFSEYGRGDHSAIAVKGLVAVSLLVVLNHELNRMLKLGVFIYFRL
jgi:nucleoside phosphorylase